MPGMETVLPGAVDRETAEMVTRLRDELRRALGDNLRRLTLYGSRARGDAAPDSDVDVLVVLERVDEPARRRVHQLAYRLMWESNFERLLTLNIIDAAHYARLTVRRSSYLRNVEREGAVLWPTPA